MLRGYRIAIFAALAGLVFIAFGTGFYSASLPSPKDERHQSYGYANEDGQKPPASIANLPKAEQDRTPCVNPQSATESDLCAQWRAAKATEKAANWTLIGVFATMIGTAFLLWQIMLTREAVKDTGDATIAMQEANTIAREAQRPRIAVTVDNNCFIPLKTPKLALDVTNIGNAAAIITSVAMSWRRSTDFDEIALYVGAYQNQVLSPGASNQYVPRDAKPPDHEYIGGYIGYQSHLGSHLTYFCFRVFYKHGMFMGRQSSGGAIECLPTDWPTPT
jgi:hypothetical protein